MPPLFYIRKNVFFNKIRGFPALVKSAKSDHTVIKEQEKLRRKF
jgi:hypothetical protein